MVKVGHSAYAIDWTALLVPTNPTEFWTLALTAATIALAVVAFFGLRSVSLSKKDIKNRTTREAAQAAIDHCDEMACQLVPMFNEIMVEISAKHIPLFVNDPSEVSFESTEEVKKSTAPFCGWAGLIGP